MDGFSQESPDFNKLSSALAENPALRATLGAIHQPHCCNFHHPMSHHNQRVFITAAAAGIGRVMAQAFVQAGARVFIGDVDARALESTLGANPAMAGMVCDVTDEAQVAAFSKSAPPPSVDSILWFATQVSQARRPRYKTSHWRSGVTVWP